MNKILAFVFFTSLFLLNSCNRPQLDVPIDSVDLSIQFVNLDSIEFSNASYQLKKIDITSLSLKKDQILSYQFNYCLGVGNVNDDSSYYRLNMFTKDPYFERVHSEIKKQVYPSLTTFNTEILNGFKRIKFHDKNFQIPSAVVYMNSAFSSSIFSTENEIGVSLERYLNSTARVIQELPSDPFFDWVKNKFDKKYLVRDLFMGWFTTHFVNVDQGNLSEKMIAYGKALYLVKAALPKSSDDLILRYSNEDYQWAIKNEGNFWDYLVKQKLLYTSNERDHANFLGDAPHTVGLPEAGPDRLGQFIGLQMIHSYVNKYPKTTLKELVSLPYTTIIKEYDIK